MQIMKRIKSRNLVVSVLLAATFLASSISVKAASVWKVTAGANTVYFGGTVHILKAENLPLPSEYETAYAASDKLVFETDINGLKTMAFQQNLMSKVMLTDGTTLQTRLSSDTYTALKAYLDAKGMPIEPLHMLKPSFVALTITMLEYQMNGFNQEGVDAIYAAKAETDGKQVDWFESVDEQIEFIVNLGGDDDNAMIKYTLEELHTLPIIIDDMLSAWLAGDLDKLNRTLVEDMASSSPKIYQDLLVTRNNNWMPKIMTMLQDAPTEFILVGAGHLAGKDSLFAKLEAQGYKIEKVK